MPTNRVARVNNKLLGCVALLGVLAVSSAASANMGGGVQPREGFRNSVSAGISVGQVLTRDADFWGLSVAYARRLKGPWMIDVAVVWDRETEKKPKVPSVVIDSYTVASTIGYSFNKRFSLSAGAGKGFASNDRTAGSIKFESGDLSFGLIGTLSTDGFRFLDRDSISFSLSWEYNATQKEPSVSADVVMSWSY